MGLFLGFFLFVSVLAATAGSFAEIRLEPRANPQGFENARRYEVVFLASEAGSLEEVDPSPDAKVEEIDFVLAGIVREYLKLEYEGNGLKADVQKILPTTASEILDLVAGEYAGGTPKWDPANRKVLEAYLGNDVSSILLFKMHAVVTVSGVPLETVFPIIIRWKACPAQRDLVTLFFVTTGKGDTFKGIKRSTGAAQEKARCPF